MGVSDHQEEFAYSGLKYHVEPDVYEPHDDTWLLVDRVAELDWQGKRVLEVGCGAGLALLAAVRAGARGVGSDRNPAAVRLVLKNAGLNGLHGSVDAVRADLLGPLCIGGFHRILFNPPYLPADPDQVVRGPLRYALEGGPSGDEVIDRFQSGLQEQAAAGQKVPEVVLVLSNHNDARRIRKRMTALGLNRVVAGAPRRYFFHQVWSEHYLRDDPHRQ